MSDHVFQGPPFDEDRLHAILTRPDEDGAHSVARWLLRQSSAAAMADEIAAAWRRTESPLSQWADSIVAVQGCWGPGDGVLLRVVLDGLRFKEAYQEAPLTQADLEDECGLYVRRLPRSWARLAQAAPGLALSDIGRLCSREHARTGLWAIACWLDDDEEARARMDRYERQHVDVIAEDGIGNMFILDADGGVSFFDHESGEDPRRTSVTPDELLEYYLEMPDVLFDDEFLGLL